jgi:hypothetical protein
MSVTLRPTHGQHIVYSYHQLNPELDESVDVEVDGRVIHNAIVRTEHYAPEINLANGNFMWLASRLWITKFYTDGYLHGIIPNAELPALLERLNELEYDGEDAELRERYFTGVYQVLTCAMYHGADINFG